MGAFLRKDVLVYWRDRRENIISLVVPLILIVILGLVLPGWIENPAAALQLKAAYVVKDDGNAGLDQFQSSLAGKGMKESEAAVLAELAERHQPARLLRELLGGEQLSGVVQLAEMDEEQALQQLAAKEIQAVITLPEGFTLNALNRMLLGEGTGAAILLTADKPSVEVGALQGIINGFARQLNTGMAIIQATPGRTEAMPAEAALPPTGGLERIEGVRAISSFQYFTLSIGVMFAMYVAAAIAYKAVAEKRQHILQRIQLSGSHPFSFLWGKIGSTLVMALTQLTCVIGICHFLLGLFPGFPLQFWLGLVLLTFTAGLFIAAMSALFTSFMFRINPDAANAVIHTLLIIIGIVGGNFVPVYALPHSVQQLWEWTPNGLWLSTVIQWIQQESWTVAVQGMLGLALFAAAAVALSIWIFPKRGRA
ncbi:MAG: transporter permease [Paenibacillaceae bacterium]|nr:transporter permease [Paenibacillaceae bacterium]